jgi:hypothetical protein
VLHPSAKRSEDSLLLLINLDGWKHNVTVPVYISSLWDATQRSIIFNGIKSWSEVNGVNYGTAPIVQASKPTASGRWVFVDMGTATCAGSNNLAELINGPDDLQHSVITINRTTVQAGCPVISDTTLAGVIAHEEGHSNFLYNCPTCPQGSSALAGQAYQPGQPTTPTACDYIWSTLWYLIF